MLSSSLVWDRSLASLRCRGFLVAMAIMASAMAVPLSFSSSSATFTPRLPHVSLASSCYASVSGRPCRVATMSLKTLSKGFTWGFWQGDREFLEWGSTAGSSRGVEKRCRGARIQASLDVDLEDAARQTVDYFVKSGMAVGLGTGRASGIAIYYIGRKLRDGSLRNIVGVPMSSSSAAAAAQAGVPLVPFEDQSELDVAFDDADTVQEGTLFAVVGRKGVAGRQSILKDKAMMKAAKQMVFIIDRTKFVEKLEGAIPVLIQQENWIDVAEEIDDLFLGDAEVWRRPSFGEAGPMGGDHPLVTPEGHFVLDVIFTTPIKTAVEVAESLETIDGVLGHGLILDAAYAAAVAGPGGVKIRTSLFKTAFME